jgi:methylmalonyl-CoA mutase N-terminal domain/subunit
MPDKANHLRDSILTDLASDRHPSPEEIRWAEQALDPALAKFPEHAIGKPTGINRDETGAARFTTISGAPIRRLYTEADLPEDWRQNQGAYLGAPGQPPYTRGLQPTGYRGRLWTMRQFSGFASPEETNLRYKYLLEGGAGGLSVAFDLPTLMGCDSDDPKSEGEVGKCGVAIDSLEDMETLFAGIPLASTTVSMTINSPAAVLWAMYLVVAERQGADWQQVSGTLQNDILKEYIAQKEYLYPPAPSMRLVIDTLEFGARHTPRFNPISNLRLPHSRSRIDRAPGTGLHALRRQSSTSSGVSAAGSPSMTSPRASVSSSTRTTISLRRSPNIALPAKSGIAS